jgi:hypothetical protein
MRELKRQVIQLQSKVKFLEEENGNLNEKIETTVRERNKLRRDTQNTFTSPAAVDILDGSSSTSVVNNGSVSRRNASNSNVTRSISIDPFDKTFKANSLSMSYWNELNTSSCWDINYNTGLFVNRSYGKDALLKGSHDAVVANHKNLSSYGYKKELSGSPSSDCNTIFATPRSYR